MARVITAKPFTINVKVRESEELYEKELEGERGDWLTVITKRAMLERALAKPPAPEKMTTFQYLVFESVGRVRVTALRRERVRFKNQPVEQRNDVFYAQQGELTFHVPAEEDTEAFYERAKAELEALGIVVGEW